MSSHIVISKDLILEFERRMTELERQMTKLVALRRALRVLNTERRRLLGVRRRLQYTSRRAPRNRSMTIASPKACRYPAIDDRS
jgi:hypothetical protein